MRNKEYWIEWAKRAGIRAVKTTAQAAVAGIGAAAVIEQVDWRYVVSMSILAGVASLLTSVAGLPEMENSSSVEYDEGFEPDDEDIAEADETPDEEGVEEEV